MERVLLERVEGLCDLCNKPFSIRKKGNHVIRNKFLDGAICTSCNDKFYRGNYKLEIK